MATPITNAQTTSKKTDKPSRASARARKAKSPWQVFAGKVDAFLEFLGNLDKLSKTPVDAKYVAALKNLGESVGWDVHQFAALKRSLMGLDAEGVPLPRPPRFSVGDLVHVPKSRHKIYNAFMTAQQLGKLRIERVSDDNRQFICVEITARGTTGDVVHVRSPSHLAPLKD